MNFWKYFFGKLFNFIKGFFSKFLVGIQFVFLITYVVMFANFVGEKAIAEALTTSDIVPINYCVGIILSCITSLLFGFTMEELINKIYVSEFFDFIMNLRTKEDIEAFLAFKHPFLYIVNFLVPMVTIGLVIYLTTYATFFKCLLGFSVYGFGHVILFSYAMYIFQSEETKLKVLEKL